MRRGRTVACVFAMASLAAAWHHAGRASEAPARPLGERLFHDAGLSGSGRLSCASCHSAEHGYSDAEATPTGSAGRLRRKSPTLLGLRDATVAGWSGRFGSLEEVACFALTSPTNMASEDGRIARRLKEAYGVSMPAAAARTKACSELAAYVRTLRAAPSPYDRYAEGDGTAIDGAAKRGLALFRGKAGCASCHSGQDLTDNAFHDVGAGREPDPGRGAAFPGSKALEGAFKTPSLRDVATRAPYMHDGSVATLADVVEGYDRGGASRMGRGIRPLGLTSEERADLVAFLRSLTGSRAPE